jgi:hypothetical protein
LVVVFLISPVSTERAQRRVKNVRSGRHCQSKFVYFAKTSEPDFAAIDFPAFFRVDLSGSMAAPSIWNFALTTPQLPFELTLSVRGGG